MDEQIKDTIKLNFGDLRDIKTEDFYNDYYDFCIMRGVKPRPKNVVIREACAACGMKTKQIHVTYTVFCEGE